MGWFSADNKKKRFVTFIVIVVLLALGYGTYTIVTGLYHKTAKSSKYQFNKDDSKALSHIESTLSTDKKTLSDQEISWFDDEKIYLINTSSDLKVVDEDLLSMNKDSSIKQAFYDNINYLNKDSDKLLSHKPVGTKSKDFYNKVKPFVTDYKTGMFYLEEGTKKADKSEWTKGVDYIKKGNSALIKYKTDVDKVINGEF